MKIKKSLLVAGAVTTLGLASATGVGIVSAANDPGDGVSNLVTKIAEKFNLNKDEVKAVFEEERAAQESLREQEVTEQLDKAVAEGKITAEQKTAIAAKLQELKASRKEGREAFKDKTHEQRHEMMEQKKTELEKWAQEQNIPKEYLKYVMSGGVRHGPMHSKQ